MQVITCGIHGFGETIGIDVDEFRVFWKLNIADEHGKQVAYHIVVSETKVVDERGLCFDSGRVESNEQRNILCNPRDGFKSTTPYYWTVTVWDQHGNEAISSVNEFYTSYPRSSRLLPPYSMNQTYMPHSSLIFRTWFEDEANRWKAVWIGNGSDKPFYVRKSFTFQRKPSRVIVLASGLGHFNLAVNGKSASSHVLDPGWTNYHRTVQFVGYDVTQHISQGENAIGAHVGNGFYAGDQGDRFFWPMYEDNTYVRYGNELCFFAEIHAHYEDGTHECIISDPSWKVRKSATTLANIYASEDHDRRAYPVGWDAPGFDDVDWQVAKPLTGPRGNQVMVKPGVIMYDLGQNASIMVRVVASGIAGAEYRVRYSETIGEDGLVLMPDPLFKEFETGVYSKITLSGQGEQEVWTPDFSFTSARYIQVEGASLDGKDGLPIIHSLTARHVSSGAPKLGFVKTDKEDVNALIKACYWTFSSNIFSYHTDCPQIEKFGWLEVTSLLFPATQYVRDMEAVYSKILDDIIDAQESSGLVPTMAPLVRYMLKGVVRCMTLSPGEAPSACFQSLLNITTEAQVSLPRSIDHAYSTWNTCEVKNGSAGLSNMVLGIGATPLHLGTTKQISKQPSTTSACKNVAMMAKELGLVSDEARFTSWAERIYDVYNQQLLVTDKTTYPYAFYTSRDSPDTQDRTMVAQAVALQHGLVPPQHRADVIQAFVAAAEDSGHVMRAGEIGLKYLWNTLAEQDVDRPDIVLNMIRQEEHPSYMRFLRRGETSLLEFWQDNCRSKCHDMLGTIYEWFYDSALGVRSLSDAYRTWRLKPCFKAEFDYVEGEIESPYGLISVRFDRRGKQDKAKGDVDVSVPAGTLCELILPCESSTVEIQRLPVNESRSFKGKTLTLLQGHYRLDITA
ncbi:hypothetical protein CEP52_014865 [Fusarium oligoseptatum]|uniref:alpha-L-rhamnosidase n=1 Tax=Fusarium oligoseptatum TaxID=2604345 RepID=A0A428SIB6_9HYPO|nr:hypothetical protein CEP52_014865 [Fusarium oligoseptatum]